MKQPSVCLWIGTGALLFIAALLGQGGLFGSSPARPESSAFYRGAACAPDALLVKFKPGVDEADVRRAISLHGAWEERVIPGIRVRRLGLPAGTSLSAKIAELQGDQRVAYAQPDYHLRLAETTPDDAYFGFQWALRNTGQAIAPPSFNLMTGTAGADIKAAEAWDIFQGTTGTLVAVVDTGVDMTHPDLVNRIYSPGRDFANDDFDAQDDHGHGTHVSGIIAAQGNNGLGVSGVNWNAWILPVKVFDKNARGLASWVVEGIIWAAENGVRVINMSLGGQDVEVNQALEDAIRFAFERNIVLVAAAGNNGTEGVWFPAAYEDHVLAAAAVDQNDAVVTIESTDGWWGSNWGPEVDVAAPGRDILSTWGLGLSLRNHPGWSGYAYGRGTSDSTAFVSGLAALLIGFKPDLTNRQVMDLIRHSADDINADTLPGRDDHMGYGRINAGRALLFAAFLDIWRGSIVPWTL